MASSNETTPFTEEERQQNRGLYHVLVEFIYNFENFQLTPEETNNVIANAVAHYLNTNDDRLDERLGLIAEAIMFNNPDPTSMERQTRQIAVLDYLIKDDSTTSTISTISTDDVNSDISESDNNDYDSDATTDQREIEPNQHFSSLLDDNATQYQLGGKRRQKRKGILPQLKPVTMKNKKYTYKLNDPSVLRHKAIDEGIRYENKYMNKTKKQAAISKKGRFNILRIYRRNNNLKECKILTEDMEYMDKKYKLGKTSKICKNKNRTRKRKISKKTTKKKRIKKTRRKR